MTDRMIARCGLICTDCGAYRATRTMDKAAAKKVADEWSKAFHVKVKVQDVWCDGCLVGGKKCKHCGECEIRACAEKRGVANCAKCADYGCAKLSAMFQMVPQAKATLDGLR